MIVVPSSRRKAERILKFAKLSADWGEAPSVDAVKERDQVRMLASEDWQTEITESESAMVDRLVEKFSAQQIAAAYLRQYSNRHSAPEELAAVQGEKSKPRVEFGPSVWFSVSEGRNQNASPRHLLPMVCKAGNITKDDIGAIRIADDLSYIEIRASIVDGFLKAIGSDMKIEGSKDIVRLDTAPDLPAFERPKSDRARAVKPRHRKGDTPPTDWNDAPNPRRRKPKPEDRAPRKSADQHHKTKEADKGAHAPLKKRKTSDASLRDHSKADPKAGAGGHSKPRKSGPKGPPPPKGKSNSKKNRARAAAKAAQGGRAAPKRR